MNTVISILQMLVRLCFLVLLVLGIMFWTGHGLSLIPLHMGVGYILVLSLWLTSIIAAIARAPIGLVIVGLIWGLIVVGLGIEQMTLLVGSSHWIVQVLHLLAGMMAIGLNERLASLAKSDSQAAQQAAN
jgi:hypothetical protein